MPEPRCPYSGHECDKPRVCGQGVQWKCSLDRVREYYEQHHPEAFDRKPGPKPARQAEPRCVGCWVRVGQGVVCCPPCKTLNRLLQLREERRSEARREFVE